VIENRTAARLERPFVFVRAKPIRRNRCAVTVEIVRIEIVSSDRRRRCVSNNPAPGIVIGALSRKTDIVDAGVAGQILLD